MIKSKLQTYVWLMGDLYIYINLLSFPDPRIFQLNDEKKMVEIRYSVE